MGKIVAFSGSHGTGKTTTINSIRDAAGDSIVIDDFKVSRTVQKDMGYDRLEQAYETMESMIAFQLAILDAKYMRDLAHVFSNEKRTIITERSFVDIAAYTAEWIKRLSVNETPDRIDEVEGWFQRDFLPLCLDRQLRCYAGCIFVPIMHEIKFEDDPNRADRDSRVSVHNNVKHHLENLRKHYKHRLCVLEDHNLEKRVAQSINFINETQ